MLGSIISGIGSLFGASQDKKNTQRQIASNEQINQLNLDYNRENNARIQANNDRDFAYNSSWNSKNFAYAQAQANRQYDLT